MIDNHKGIFLQLSFEQRKKSRANKKKVRKIRKANEYSKAIYTFFLPRIRSNSIHFDPNCDEIEIENGWSDGRKDIFLLSSSVRGLIWK